MDNDDLKLDDYKGKLPLYTIKALRNYRKKNNEKIKKWSNEYYERNKDKVKMRQGRQTAIKRIMEGKKVSKKTREKYEIPDDIVYNSD